nr:MAG: replication associated protein [Cressdnaviricota sp.]
MSSCNWVFTLHWPSVENSDDNPEDWQGVQYLVYQLEQGGVTGMIHFQGYLIMKNKVRLSAMKKLNPRATWAIRAGTHDEARAYCVKEGRLDGPYELGQPPAQGKRNDLLEVKRKIDTGATMLEIADAHFGNWVRYHKAFTIYRNMHLPDRHHVTECRVYWGPTGVGKSRRAHVEAPGSYVVPRGDWWDGYDAHETVIIDEFYGWIQYSLLLNVLDRYPLLVPFKGGFSKFVAKLVIITSNKPPTDWYRNPGCDYAPLARRFTLVERMGPEGVLVGDALTCVGYIDPTVI